MGTACVKRDGRKRSEGLSGTVKRPSKRTEERLEQRKELLRK